MVRTLSSSSSSSCASLGSFDDVTIKTTVKFLCSYGGRIVPRHSDGKLRYVGGDTRVLVVDRSTPFSELHAKLRDLCGWESVRLRFQLPADDLYDALVSITSDEELANFFEEFDQASRSRIRLLPLKIRAFLFPKPSQTPKAAPTSPPLASMNGKSTVQSVPHSHRRIHHQISAPMRFSGRFAGDPRVHGCCIAHGCPWPHQYLVRQY